MKKKNFSVAILDKKYLWHPFTQQSEWEQGHPFVVDRAKGVYLFDEKGNKFIDGVSSLWVSVHGHNHPVLNRALRKQLNLMAHTTFLGLTHGPAARLGEALIRLAPAGLQRVFYSDNGATAVEVALKMAFQWNVQQGHESRTEFLALANSYHGDTLGAVSVGGISAFHKKFKPLLFKSHFAPAPFCFSCPFRRRPACMSLRSGSERQPPAPRPGESRVETGCRWECLSGAEKIMEDRKGRLSAAIVEPVVQGASGMRVMPRGYLKGLSSLCQKHGLLFIADEVATGFGRTGTLFAVEQEGVRPDFLCVAKSLTGGYLPLAATLTTEKIYRSFLGRFDEFKTFFHGHTYTANPLACAVALENLALYERTHLIKTLQEKIKTLTNFLKEMAQQPGVSHARQAGFMAGIELSKADGTPFPVSQRVGKRVCETALERGVWIRPLGDVIVVLPPLAITSRELSRLLSVIRWAIEKNLIESTRYKKTSFTGEN